MSVDSLMQFATLFGGSITAIAYAPQISKMVRNKSALGNSLTAWYMWLVGVGAVLVYTIYIKDWVLILLHIAYFLCIAIVIFLIYKYRKQQN